MLYSDSLRKMMQNGGLESFWGGLGVEFEAKYIFDFRGAPRGGPPGTGGHGRAPGYVGHRNSLSRVNPRHLPNFLNTSPFCPSLEGRVFPA